MQNEISNSILELVSAIEQEADLRHLVEEERLVLYQEYPSLVRYLVIYQAGALFHLVLQEYAGIFFSPSRSGGRMEYIKNYPELTMEALSAILQETLPDEDVVIEDPDEQEMVIMSRIPEMGNILMTRKMLPEN